MDESSWIKRFVSNKHNILLVIVLSGMVFNIIYMTKYADLYSTQRYAINNTVSTSNIFITEVTQEPLLKRRAVRWMLHINSNLNISRVDEQKTIFREGKVVWMDPPGKFVNRISSYNDALKLLRTKLIQQIHLPWRDLEERITIVKGYMEETVFLAANTKLYTLVLKRRDITGQPGNSSCHNDQSNYLVHNYFTGSSTPPYCHYIRQHARQKNANATGLALYACNEDINKSLKAECLKPVDMYSRSLIFTHSEPGSTFAKYFHDYFPEYIYYIHALYDGVVSIDGYVFTGSITVIDVPCKYGKVNKHPVPPENYTSSPLYKEIFVISQYWGKGHFHKQAEDLPRIAPYIEFLKKNEQIKIQAAESAPDSVTGKTLQLMGIDPTRLVQGVVRAKIVYLPQVTDCLYSNPHLVQLASLVYRQYVDNNTPSTEINYMVMIRRNFKRKMVDYEGKERLTEILAKEFNLKFEVYSDDSLPPFDEQVKLFRRAAVIIGSHGAGLANMIYSEPGAVVIEGFPSPPYMVLCFSRLALVLGHHYHAIPSLGEWEHIINISTYTFITETKKILSAHFEK